MPISLPHQALAFAVLAHGDQKYGEQPYVCHLDDVACLAGFYGEEAETIAYLHDVVEDTPVTLDQIRAKFADRIAACVGLLTDCPGVDRAARKVATNAKLAAVGPDLEVALIVKAADRLANLRASAGGGKQLEKYRREHPEFRAAVWRDGLCEELWKEMDGILAAGTR